MLVYIDNKELLTKIVTYIDNSTTNINDNYEYILIAENNRKTNDFIEKHKDKKIIFITYLLEDNILKNKDEKLNKILNKCYKVITSLPAIKNILKSQITTEIIIIEKELPIINISKTNSDIYNKYKISKRKKKIIIFDFYYENINIVNEIANKYPKYNFIYIGYKSYYKLKEIELNKLHNMPNNISFVKYYDFNILSDLCKISYLIINFNQLDISYLYMVLVFKKQLLTKKNKKYDEYLINSKNTYIFIDSKELLIKLNKIIDNRIANLTDIAYDLIKNNTFNEIKKKYSFIIR